MNVCQSDVLIGVWHTFSPPQISQYIKLCAFGLGPKREPGARVRPLSLKSFTQNHPHTNPHQPRLLRIRCPRTHHAAAAGGSVGSLLHIHLVGLARARCRCRHQHHHHLRRRHSRILAPKRCFTACVCVHCDRAKSNRFHKTYMFVCVCVCVIHKYTTMCVCVCARIALNIFCPFRFTQLRWLAVRVRICASVGVCLYVSVHSRMCVCVCLSCARVCA